MRPEENILDRARWKGKAEGESNGAEAKGSENFP